MFVELHVIQNFAPSNLNRDDTNAPKDCEFGGYRRARISSQCIKRAIRAEFRTSRLLDDEHLSSRTRRLLVSLCQRLASDDRDAETVEQVAEFAIESTGLKLTDKGQTEYLLFLADESIGAFSALIDTHWDELAASVKAQPMGGKKSKKKSKGDAPEVLKEGLDTLLDGTRAADLALFGRMLADIPASNVEAAAQVAHAISTNKVEMEFDFFTAVDDLQADDEAGAGMMGTVEFNSSCFYRYANVDIGQLVENLGGDSELAAETVSAFVRATVTAVPTGKQNSMAAQNPPSLVVAVVRDAGLWSLANAFVEPVWARRDGDLVSASIQRIDSLWTQLTAMYGKESIRQVSVLAGSADGLDSLAGSLLPVDGDVSQIDQLVYDVVAAAIAEEASA